MKWAVSLLCIVLLGGLAGSWIKNLSGYVLVAHEKTTYEMRLWIAVCFLLIIFGLFLFIVYVIKYFFSSGIKLKNWNSQRSSKFARKKTIEGVLAFAEARWDVAERALIKAAPVANNKLINYLVAAEAAQYQKAETRRDNYLRLAHQSEPNAKFAIGLTQAKLQIEHNQDELALASLKELKLQSPHHPYVLKLLCYLYEKLEDWNALYELLDSLRKYKVCPEEELQKLEETCISSIINMEAKKNDFEVLQDRWSKFSAKQRKSSKNIISYVKLLIEFEQIDQAEVLTKGLIKKQSNSSKNSDIKSEAIALYSNISTEYPEKQLKFLEGWMKSQKILPNEIHLALGKICFYAKLWGKSQHYLELALQKKPRAEVYLFMAQTLEYLNDTQKAMDYYKQGLTLLVDEKWQSKLKSLPLGTEDLINANLLPSFQRLEKADPV